MGFNEQGMLAWWLKVAFLWIDQFWEKRIWSYKDFSWYFTIFHDEKDFLSTVYIEIPIQTLMLFERDKVKESRKCSVGMNTGFKKTDLEGGKW